MPDPTSPTIGQRLGDYVLREEIGAGGFSIVFRAEHVDTGAIVALKLPRVEEFLSHLRREAAIAARFHDPQVVGVEEAHLDNDPPFLVMRYVPGASLELPEEPPKPHSIVLELERFWQVATVVARLHDAGIAHGDLKPGNIRIAPVGIPHILDLGLARCQVNARQVSTLRASVVSVTGKGIAGTLEYMSPELMAGEKPGPAADVYALGVVLHHILCGRPPAFGVSPRELNPYLPPGTSDLLRQMLHPDPVLRLATARALLPIADGLIVAERRCLRRRNGHQRRLVFRERMRSLTRGASVLMWAAFGVCLGFFGWPLLLQAARATGTLDTGYALLCAVAFPLGLFLGGTALLMGMTTLNAWLLGIPEKSYKDRPGHSLWTFMMQ